MAVYLIGPRTSLFTESDDDKVPPLVSILSGFVRKCVLVIVNKHICDGDKVSKPVNSSINLGIGSHKGIWTNQQNGQSHI